MYDYNRNKTAGNWKPYTDTATGNEGFIMVLGAAPNGLNAIATNTKDRNGNWVCKILVGGSVASTGVAKVPAKAAAEAREALEHLIASVR